MRRVRGPIAGNLRIGRLSGFPPAHCAAFCAALLVAALLGPRPGVAEDRSPSSRSFFRCDTRHATFRDFARSDASIDVYHGLTWLAGGATLSLGTNPSRRWSHENGFDTGIQSGLRLDSSGARRDANLSSDFMVALSIGLIPGAAIGAEFARTHDCVETWDMFGEAFESVSLAVFVSEAIKVAAGRERPLGDRCRDSDFQDADCRDDDRNLSFVSGHAMLAAAGAGISCRFALERHSFGPSPTARIAPCGLGLAAALTAGMLRISSDRHWASDVLAGFGIGAVVGYFDSAGPFEWLRLDKRDASSRIEMSGRVLPFASEGRFGAQWTMVY